MFAAAQELRTFMFNGLYGFMKNDRVVIPATYSYASNFNSGRAAVLLNKKWGFIDTKGTLVIPNNLERVENFKNGYALYYEGTKAGLLDTMGNKVVPAVCDEIYEFSDYYSLKRDGKYGSYLPQSNVYIEPKYGNYYLSNHFIVAKNGDFFDVYTEEGKLIGHNVVHSPTLLGRYNTKACDLIWEDSVHIVDQSGKPVTKTYSRISQYNCETRRVNPLEGYYDYSYHVYLLHLPSESMIYDEYGDEVATNAFHLYFEDGRLFDDAVYSDFSNANYEYTVKRNNFLCGISEEGDLIRSNYIGKGRFASYTLFYLPDSTVDVAGIYTNYDEVEVDNTYSVDTNIVAHFKRVRVLMHEVYTDYYNPEYFTEEGMMTMVPIPFEVLEVEGEGEHSGKFALYDFVRQQYISPFDTQRKELDDIEYEYSNKTFAVFRNEQGLIAYSIDGNSSPYQFESYEKINGMGYLLKDSTGKTVLVSFTQDTVLNIPAGIEVTSSSSITTGTYDVDPETGELYLYDGIQEFNFEFLVLTNKEEQQKFGFIDYQSNLILPQYDSIFAPNACYVNDQQYPIISTKKNGKYGAYDLKLGSAIQPKYDSILKYEYNVDYNIVYVQPSQQKYYLNTRGKQFKSLNYSVETFTQNNKVGFRNGTDFEEEFNFNDTVVPAVFKKLEQLDDMPYCVATNFEKKQGVINTLGDTLIPFIYDNVYWESDWSFPDGNDEYGWFRTTVGKQYGLHNVRLDKAIEPKYDDIIWVESGIQRMVEEMESPSLVETVNTFLVVRDDKCGLYSESLTAIVPYGSDGIDLQPIYETLMLNVQQGDKVGSFYYSTYYPALTETTSRWYDFIVEGYGYRKNEGRYNKYEIVSGVYVGTVDSFEVDPEICSYEVFEKNGLLGLRDVETKKVVMKPQVRYLRFIDSDTVVKFIDGVTYYGSIYKNKSRYLISEW